MRTGMLWFDNDPKAELSDKVLRAAAYYQKKYGLQPNLCFVHPSMLAAPSPRAGSIELRTSKQVLPNHLWLGVNDPGAA
ncbi:MAG: hypothetical protein JW987_17235 [Anaerolineaceae bacterium]|nr:hypothetical protein [Anaerolineaceae bacterium]